MNAQHNRDLARSFVRADPDAILAPRKIALLNLEIPVQATAMLAMFPSTNPRAMERP